MTKGKPSRGDSAFVMVPQEVIDATRLIGARGLALLVLLYAHRNRRTGACFPRIETLATELGCKRRAVERLLRTLEGAGFVRRSHRIGSRGGWSSNTYELILPRCVKNDAPSVRQERRTPYVKNDAAFPCDEPEEKNQSGEGQFYSLRRGEDAIRAKTPEDIPSQGSDPRDLVALLVWAEANANKNGSGPELPVWYPDRAETYERRFARYLDQAHTRRDGAHLVWKFYAGGACTYPNVQIPRTAEQFWRRLADIQAWELE